MKIQDGIRLILCVAVIAGLWACDADPVEMNGGKLPDKDGLENTYGMLRSNRASGNQVRMVISEGSGFVTDRLFYQITQPAQNGLSIEARIDASKLEAFNATAEATYTMLPDANYDFLDGKKFELSQTDKRSAGRRLKISAANLAPGNYLLPVTVSMGDTEAEKETIYYRVVVRQRQMGDFELDEDIFTVFYLNTTTYDPRLIDDYFMRKEETMDWTEVWYRTIGNIVNLETCTLGYDEATGRALLKLTSDMRYVLDHADTYIRPLQDKGRKICLCLEGGGSGLGFCNLSDTQIADFAAQVKAVIAEFGLDGINLWDRNSGYGKEGMPAMNKTSYPKLVVALRDALGADKLLTLTDHKEPTEYFWDRSADGTNGIAVGEYLDYAWSGYRDGMEKVQICDPWHPGATGEDGLELVSPYTHKPIAGLDASKYGCINIPWYGSDMRDFNSDQLTYHVMYWRQAGYKPNQILVFEDARTNRQDKYEGMWDQCLSSAYRFFADDGVTFFENDEWGGWGEEDNFYSFDPGNLRNMENQTGYDKWLKDW